jgi:hypothetical protein
VTARQSAKFARAAGPRFSTNRKVFIGLENINPDSLKGASKGQNHISEYRTMLQAWRNVRVLTCAGYILGFPSDTPESIARDIGIIQRVADRHHGIFHTDSEAGLAGSPGALLEGRPDVARYQPV